MMTVLMGGARSGKSSLAVEMGRRHDGPVTFVATCQPTDADLAERIARHRHERPDWPTIEEPLALATVLAQVEARTFVIVDCLTLWVSNLMGEDMTDGEIEARSADTVEVAAARPGPTVAITNEVGLGVHPETALGLRYRDVLGRVNQQWAARAETALFLIAGRALTLHDPWPALS